ncbi:dimethylaniline monooxygenase [Trichoderma arundinaceum]|uniref:Dimethylaniline monooxygenase n=1 Tax=Trichoderma arundinaceum TaxID=490622 RepID=A0A395NPC8_TRIAR|nr:dimethylaniline monooxygenase [Trichoderma arundinaceum]
MRVAIIGGGPSGIVQLKVLTEAHRRFPVLPIEVRLFESHSRLGGVFSHHSYEEGELVSSKYLTAFSDFRPRGDDADFFSSDRYLEYLDDYATHFELWSYINLNTWVKSIRRGDSSEHVITYRAADGGEIEWACDAIAVCSGVHAVPNIPDLPGVEHVPVVMHSAGFKSREQFGKGKTVMVIGSGETSADICYLAITGDTERVVLCHRDGWLGAPKAGFQVSVFYPGSLAPSHTNIRSCLSMCLKLLYSTPFFFNKAWQRISNHVSAPWRPTKWSLATRIRRFFFHTDIPPVSRTIDVAPIPSHISEDGVAHFPLNGRPESERINETVVKPDVIIFATGYLPACQAIWKADDPTIGFIGFVRPGFGAIPPLAEMQAMLFTMNLVNRIPKPLDPEDEWHYRIIHSHDARVTYGVEHDSYAYQLAKDIDGAPTFTEVLKVALQTKKGWRLPYIWAAGASFNTKFRLRGPWKWEGAGEVMTGELWETIQRREGLFGNIPLGIVPMIYLGSINLYYVFYAHFWGFCSKIGLSRPIVIRNEPKRIMQEMEQAYNLRNSIEPQLERYQDASFKNK